MISSIMLVRREIGDWLLEMNYIYIINSKKAKKLLYIHKLYIDSYSTLFTLKLFSFI